MKFIDRGDRVFTRKPVEFGTPCAACGELLIEKYSHWRWCDCPLCVPCARGIVARCPSCFAEAPVVTDADVHVPERSGAPRDFSGWRSVLLFGAIGPAILLLGWWLEW